MERRYETFTVLIASVSRSIRRIKTEVMAGYDLKSPHVSCLYYLYKKPSMTAAELCELCEEDKAAVSRSLLFLEQNGYLVREGGSPEETRVGGKHYRAPLTLTEKGMTVAQSLIERIDRVLNMVSEGVSEDDRVILYRSLEQINRNLRDICEKYEKKS